MPLSFGTIGWVLRSSRLSSYGLALFAAYGAFLTASQLVAQYGAGRGFTTGQLSMAPALFAFSAIFGAVGGGAISDLLRSRRGLLLIGITAGGSCPGLAITAGGSCPGPASQLYLTIIQVMTMIPLADAKARLSAVLDDVRDTHDRVVITRNGRPEAVIISVADLETIEETLDLLSTPGAIDEIRTAEAEIARGEATGADELRRLMAERVRKERHAG
ncbi:MAG: type II toxin-antitoxin system Phd/YefM family antitoxin [Streptosporangiaceae bacterium]